MEIVPALVWVLIGLLVTFGRRLDRILVVAFVLYNDWELLQELWFSYVNTTYVVYGMVVASSGFISLQVLRYALHLSAKDSVLSKDKFPVGPLLFPCRTDHARLVPKKHSFSYSYLLVGIPIDWKGNNGGMISCGQYERSQPWYMNALDALSFGLGGTGAWWSVNADDYLGRGHDKNGLRGKLETYLETQGVDPAQYAHAYLLTAARFLGYASNPVSIWHLYSADYELKALVLEVNNTFDERHNYFLEPAVKNPDAQTTRYTGTWPKDFYVSVFNSRSGAYSLSAIDPLGPILRSQKSKDKDACTPITNPAAHIDATITLSLPLPSTKPMLVARVFSSSSPVNPSSMSVFEKSAFLLSWFWVGFATFPRTVQQALIILFRVKMPWVFTPQPRANTMPAKASPAETIIEKQFRDFLRHVVQQSQSAIRVRYIPAGIIGAGAEEEVMVDHPLGNADDLVWRDLEVRILTPLFYSRIVCYPSIHDGLLSEQHSATLSLSNPSELTSLDFTSSHAASTHTSSNLLFSLLSFLKRSPSPIEPLADERATHAESDKLTKTPQASVDLPSKVEWDAKSSQRNLSGLDAFVLASKCPCAEAREERALYASSVLKLLLAQRLGAGKTELLDLEILVAKVLVAWALVRMVV